MDWGGVCNGRAALPRSTALQMGCAGAGHPLDRRDGLHIGTFQGSLEGRPAPCDPGACVTGFASAARRPRTVALTCAPSYGRCLTCGPAPPGRDGLAPASPL